ncbi:MAG: DUF21 domain-containing protein [Methanocalculus sp. MSAO_Arc1]|uniref:DUF21 domain-containing protein n=1 Tax=Methanocalculus TaxID=71151 RepID=UPI000FEE073E|nr:DUF21 domain-containing protein [Methanocalculus sp. MSAO_Arc1]MCP1662802.1 hypothetical protein [Methanocalculus sp. AMF5]RQD79030.1 MAG: DUF21 domain-containing protein [Methanocalculus sp. MSAO_Arc1]
MTQLVWIGILICISQSAIFSGLNLACFTISRLELTIEARRGNRDAKRVLALRENANFLLVTILWGNVAINVLLALLANSVLAGVAAFLFSTVVITIVGEIAPQAYFSRHALRVASFLSPILRFYQIILYPVAWPTAVILNRLLGPEGIRFFREKDLRELIWLHMESSETEIERMEGQGALNFLALDDVGLAEEGERIDPDSVVIIDFENTLPVFPHIRRDVTDPFLQEIQRSGKKWIVLTDPEGMPRLVLDSDEFIRDALFNSGRFVPLRHCHRPIITKNKSAKLGDVIPLLKVKPIRRGDDVIDDDVILLWSEDEKRVITGGDVLGRLFRGIVQNPVIPDPASFEKS